ncbi:hypothetical protein BN1110_02872 [bacterium YEK0313]|nr:hypothetical protein BN1110_02872 [bacterium YEK0313]
MKFAPSKLFIESYDKCPNCGLLIYEKPAFATNDPVIADGKTFCSQWCVDWDRDRADRRRAKEEGLKGNNHGRVP